MFSVVLFSVDSRVKLFQDVLGRSWMCHSVSDGFGLLSVFQNVMVDFWKVLDVLRLLSKTHTCHSGRRGSARGARPLFLLL